MVELAGVGDGFHLGRGETQKNIYSASWITVLVTKNGGEWLQENIYFETTFCDYLFSGYKKTYDILMTTRNTEANESQFYDNVL